MRNFLNLFCFLLLASIAGAETFEVLVPFYEVKDNRVRIESFGSLLEPGKPWLPCKVVWIVIPPGSEITRCKVKRGVQFFVDTCFIIPTPLKIREGDYFLGEKSREYREICDSIYALNQWYPASGGKFLRTQEFHGYTLAKVVIFPLAYNPMAQELRYFPNITIDIDYASGLINQAPIEVDTTFDYILRDKVFNFEQRSEWYVETRCTVPLRCEYVIIAPEELVPHVQDFAEWKESIGYKVKIISREQINEIRKPKYVLVIGEPIELEGVIIGRIPYTDPALVTSILDRTIEFELNKERKKVLFVKGVANYANEDFSGVIMEDKSALMRELKFGILKQVQNDRLSWDYDEFAGQGIPPGYSIINFLTLPKNWVWDDGDGVPGPREIKLSNFSLLEPEPCFIFSPFSAVEFLKEGAVCAVAPDSSAYYLVGWSSPMDGGSQSFNYEFLKCLMEREIVGDVVEEAKFWYGTYFPLDTQDFKIWGDPALHLRGIPGVDLGITWTNIKWLPSDTSISPQCRVVNFGRILARNCKIYCEIDSAGVPVYSECIEIKVIKAKEEKDIEFPEWREHRIGIGYKVEFGLFSPQDENPVNDTLSTRAWVVGGDFLVLDQDTAGILYSVLCGLGYKGVWTDEISSVYPLVENFSSLFISNVEVDSLILPTNLYVEGSNLWLSKLLKGREISDTLKPPVSGKGFSFSCCPENLEWFIPDDCVSIFKDSRDSVAGFCYENGNRIWCTRFKISEIADSLRVPLIDSVTHFFGIAEIDTEGMRRSQESNITLFESSPNPFCDKTFIKFKIEMESCKINLSVYNLAGTLVKELLKEFLEVGEYEIPWDACDKSGKPVANGIYFLRLQSDRESRLIKLIIFE